MGYEEEIAGIRAKIDSIDAQIVPLFEARMRSADEVAEIKKRYGQSVFDAGRENAVISRALSRLQDAANDDATRRFFKALMDLSKQRQHTHLPYPIDTDSDAPPAIGYLGLRGSFSHIAACEAFGEQSPLISCDTFESIFEALRNKDIGRAILPAENTETGSITAVVDLLARYGYYITAERLLKVSQSLLGIKGAKLEQIEMACSHPEPIAQCSRFLSAHPHISAYPALSTAQAASSVAKLGSKTVGCIASAKAAKIYGLEILADNIQNTKSNSTRFIIVARKPALTAACDKTSVIFKLDHKPGALLELLRLFCDINILKLESRPLAGRPFEYLFHLDFEGSIENKHIAQVIEQAKKQAAELVWLGSYPRMTLV
ncbi:MAG: prephenate dehydratase domain-containing protein [Christensenellales bacterium]